MSNYKKFEKDAKKVKSFVEKWFGPKCEDFEPTCYCCKRHKLLKKLCKNPFKEDIK